MNWAGYLNKMMDDELDDSPLSKLLRKHNISVKDKNGEFRGLIEVIDDLCEAINREESDVTDE